MPASVSWIDAARDAVRAAIAAGAAVVLANSRHQRSSMHPGLQHAILHRFAMWNGIKVRQSGEAVAGTAAVRASKSALEAALHQHTE